MKTVNTINFNIRQDPDLIELINRFASVQRLKPTTALKRYILDTLPNVIKSASNSEITQTNNQSQE